MWKFADGIRKDALENEQWRQENTEIYSLDIPRNLDTISIKLNTEKKIHLLRFQKEDSETSVCIYDTVLNFPIPYPELKKLKPLINGKGIMNQALVIDISNVKRKNYTLLYWSSRIKGYYPLDID